MPQQKSFSPATVLLVSINHLPPREGLRERAELLNFLVGGETLQHASEARAELALQHRWLETIQRPSFTNEAERTAWLRHQEYLHGSKTIIVTAS